MKKEIKFVEDEINEEVEVQKEKDINNEFIKMFINTKLKSYLTFDELLKLTTTKVITEASEIIINHIKNLVSLTNKDIYIYNESIAIHHKLNNQMDVDNFLTVFIITFVENSISKLSKSNSDTIHKFYNTGYVRKQVLQLLKTNLRVNADTFDDPKLGEVHFKNGYIKLKTLTFHKRKRTDYMTYCLFRDYKPSPKRKREIIENVIKQIYTNEDDKNCVLESFGEGISGYSSKSQYNLFLLGIGSSGKSTLMKMAKVSFKEMIFEFKEDTFAVNNSKADRVLNMLMYNPFIRIMWVNELKGKIDDSLFKQVCEGQVNTTTLFQEGQNIIKFNALLVNTMNEFPNIKIDSGVERRIRSLEHQSRFTHNKKEVDEKNNVFLADKNLIDNITNDEELQNAFIEIICEYAHDFLNGKTYELSKNFKETKSNIVDTNDIIKEYVESHLIKTNNEKDKIDLDEIHETFKTNYPNSKITKQQLLGQLKDKGFVYNSNVRSPKDSKKRGCFVNVKFNDNEEEKGNPLDNGVEDSDDKKELIKQNERLQEENDKLKAELEKMKALLLSLQKPKPQTDEELEKELTELIQSPPKQTKEEINTIDDEDINDIIDFIKPKKIIKKTKTSKK